MKGYIVRMLDEESYGELIILHADEKFLLENPAAYCRRLRQIAAEEIVNPPGDVPSEAFVDVEETKEQR